MRRREAIFAILGVLLIAVALLGGTDDAAPQHSFVEASACRMPVSIFGASNKQAGAVVMLHGLSANRRTMFYLAEWLAAFGSRVYALDLPGHGDNVDAFNFKRAEECAQAALGELARRGEIDLQRTMLVGHSMGGAIAIRVADQYDTAATVAISPAPLTRFDSAFRRVLPYDPPAKRPNNLLVLSAEYEPGDLKRATQALVNGFGPNSVDDDAFHRRSALRWVEIPAATHVSLLFNHAAIFETFTWALRSGVTEERHDSFVVSYSVPMLALPLAILLLFPGAASVICRSFGYQTVLEISEGSGRIGIGVARIAAAWAAAAVLAVVILWLWVPLRFVRIYTGDYLASFFLLSGSALIAWRASQNTKEGFLASLGMTNVKAVAAGAMIGVVTFLAVGWWLNTQWTDAWMNGARWWRFAVLAPLLLPYFWAEECALAWDSGGRPNGSPLQTEEKSGQARLFVALRRWGMFLLLRAIGWAAMAGALWLLDSQQILIVLMTMFFLLFSVLQRMGANAVGRRAGRVAAATFSAILAAWFIAAVFPLT